MLFTTFTSDTNWFKDVARVRKEVQVARGGGRRGERKALAKRGVHLRAGREAGQKNKGALEGVADVGEKRREEVRWRGKLQARTCS